jgi:hypothetical protein
MIFRRKYYGDPMPKKYCQLATYNSECARGLVHTPQWVEFMESLQTQFNVWSEQQIQKMSKHQNTAVMAHEGGTLLMPKDSPRTGPTGGSGQTKAE